MPAEWNEGSCYVGVDLSAPKMLAGAVTPEGKLLGKVKFSAKPDRGPKVLLERVARCIRDAVDECDFTMPQVRAIGVAVPGVVDARTGLVLSAPLLGLEMEPFQRELERHVQKPVVLENECNAAAWAVYTLGLQSQPTRLAVLFLERPGVVTGIIKGQFVTGLDKSISAAFPALQTNPWEQGTQNLPKKLRKAMQAGGDDARQTVAEAARQAGELAPQIINLLQPEVLALDGTAIYELKEWLLPAILQEVRNHVPSPLREQAQIKVCHLGKEAGLIGAALLAASGARMVA